MKTEKLGQESAFPISEGIVNMCGEKPNPFGMSKRFYAACAAMQGILAGELISLRSDEKGDPAYPISIRHTFNKAKLIKNAYAIADELLTQENE